jgi:peptidoglycan/xylan/chitin deacetylase (PgdA/CDA1 family)
MVQMPSDMDLLSHSTDQIPVLTYHHLLPASELYRESANDMVVSVEQFAMHMVWLKNNGWETITTHELYEFLTYGNKLPKKPVLITFDDGYASNGDYAAPILRQLDMKATVFLITDHMKTETRLYEGKKLSWLDVKSLSDVFEFHAHTHAFHKLDAFGVPYLLSKPDEAVLQDLTQSYSAVENQLPKNSRIFAYPFGAYKDSTLTILENLNTKLAFTTDVGYANSSSSLLEIPRFTITPTTTLEAFKAIFLNLDFNESIPFTSGSNKISLEDTLAWRLLSKRHEEAIRKVWYKP